MILLDGDVLVHRVLASTTQWVRFDDVWIQTATDAQVESRMSALVTEIRAQVAKLDGQEHEVTACLSDPEDNWRVGVYAGYKRLRREASQKRSPMFFTARQYLKDNFPTMEEPGLEADDLMSLAMTDNRVENGIIVTIDKDLLSVPGRVFNPDKPERGIVTVTEDDANRAHMYQTLIGDRVDEFPGCPGIGPVRANRILDDVVACYRWNAVVKTYTKAGLDAETALAQARVARMLQGAEYNWETQEVVLWTPE